MANQFGALGGGIGLFLLGMWLMTEGLRLAAGAALRDVLAHSTRTRRRALASGVMLTALVQSSSAVTVAAIGFVNAGLLSLGQVLWVLFGANVGTTTTGWLVAVLGLQFKVELLALPLIGAGMLLRLTGGTSRRDSLGLAVAGFGVLFLGIDVLRDTFSGLAAGIDFPRNDGLEGVAAHLGLGAVLTLLMQSSSAATALTLTAAQGGLLGLEAAAAVVIGANIGTTGTAVIAAIGATANARRSAAAHVLFNVLTAVVALAALPWLLDMTLWLGDRIGAVPGIAAVLALFHTLFNVLGVILMWPLSDRLAEFLTQRFRTREEDDARPRYLDVAVTAVPTLAVEALAHEVARYGSIAVRMARTAVQTGGLAPASLASAQRTLAALDAAIDAFVVRLNRGSMTQDTAQRLAIVLRRAMYYTNVAELLPNIAAPTSERAAKPAGLPDEMARLLGAAADFFLQVDPQGSEKPLGEADAALTKWEEQYQRIKAGLLREGALGTLAPVEMESLLRSNSALRRAVQQAHKAAHAVRGETMAATAG